MLVIRAMTGALKGLRDLRVKQVEEHSSRAALITELSGSGLGKERQHVRIEIVDETMLAGTCVVPHRFGSFDDDLVGISAERFDDLGNELVERHSRFSLLTIHQLRAYPGRCD